MAYSSNESGVDDIFVRPFPGPGGKQKVSTGGGKFPTWSRTGELFYFSLSDGRIMVANYTVQGDSFSTTKPQVWSDRQLLFRILFGFSTWIRTANASPFSLVRKSRRPRATST